MTAPCGCPASGGLIRHQRGTCTDSVVARLDWYARSTGETTVADASAGPDLSVGLSEQAALIYFYVGAWHDFGYENPPAPNCKTIPPLGERSAAAIKAGHAAVEAIDELTRQLHRLREQLVGELQQDEKIRIQRVDRMLAQRRDGAR